MKDEKSFAKFQLFKLFGFLVFANKGNKLKFNYQINS